MGNTGSLNYVRHSKSSYTLAFKLMVVAEVEKGELSYQQAQLKYGVQGNSSVLRWLRSHGRLDWTLSPKLKSKPDVDMNLMLI
jgi:transposase-like protein